MVKCCLLLTLLLFFSHDISSQNNQSVTGTIVESESREPLPYVNIVLLNKLDSSQVAGTTTDVNGSFRMDNIKRGDYFLVISFIGFEKIQTPVFQHRSSTHTGTIALAKSPILLGEVEVSDEKNTFISALDKKTYNVGKDIISESGSLSEILQNIPSITVDVSGNVSLRGSPNVTFLINGKPSSQLRRNAPLALQQIPANTIERIEVITNPSAKYSPEGIGGIINIIQKKESETGMNGQLIGNIGNESRYNTNLAFSYGHRNLSALISYSLRHASGTNIYSDERIKSDLSNLQTSSYYKEDGHSTTKPLAHVFDAGLTYQMDEENLFEFSGNYFSQNSLHKGSSVIFQRDNQNQTISSLRSDNTNDEYEKEGEGGITFEHLFGGNEDHSLVFESTVAGYDEKEDQKFSEYYDIPLIESTSKKILVRKNGSQVELTSEYALPIDNESDLEAGYSGEFIYDNIYYGNENGANRFKFNQNIHAFYAIYSRDIANFNLQLGMRGEQALIKSHLVQPVNLLTNNDYFKIYPSLHLSYEIDQFQNLKFSYSKRITRPDADQLNPFPEFTDPRNAEAGNPNLLPEQIHSLELSYQRISDLFTITPSLFYRYKYDAFTSVSRLYGDSTIIATIENLSNQKSAGIEAIISGKIGKWWSYDFTSSLFYNEIDAANLGYSQNKSTTSETVELYSLFKITRKTLLQLNLSYNSPVLTPQGEKENIFYINAGIRQLLYYDQISITFTVSDLLGTYKEKLNINIPELKQATNLYRKEPVFYLGFSWRFGESYQSDENDLQFEGEGLRKL